MRARMILLMLALTAVPPLAAQRTHQFEIGAFGLFTHYDKVFNLDNQIGGGGRLGYFFSPVVGLEGDISYEQPTPKTGGANAAVALGSVSLVLNFGSEGNLFYLLGGYTRLAWGNHVSYSFTDNAVHGGLGDRIFFSDRVALRIEGRAIYAPKTGFAGGDWAGHIIGSAGLSIFTGPGSLRDSDHDGVAARRDKCPGTPAGAVVDPQGCPIDSDRDKVYDGLDACPNTVEGAVVDARGCPTDSDGDAGYDGSDKTPAARPHTRPHPPAGARVDTPGCQRASDTGADGVDDSRDKCPGTAAGTRVDAAGCPILFTEARTPVVLRGVTFETGRSALKPDSYTILDIVAASLVANPAIKIEIAGHTDNTGSPATNMRLSQARADAVRAYLASKGVAPDRMVAKGYGPSEPIAPNTTPAGRAQNRRVELRQIS